MLKQTVEYEDFDGEKVTESLHFNISKSELLENLHLRDEVQGMAHMLDGPERQLSTDEVRKLLDLVKSLIKLSYGVRKERDGRQTFEKSPEVWDAFQYSAAYDAFKFSLFENPEKAIAFVMGVFPPDLRAEAQKAMDEKQIELTTTGTGTTATSGLPGETPKSEPDYEAMLSEAPEHIHTKTSITQTQHDFMKDRLSEEQFKDFMSTREVK